GAGYSLGWAQPAGSITVLSPVSWLPPDHAAIGEESHDRSATRGPESGPVGGRRAGLGGRVAGLRALRGHGSRWRAAGRAAAGTADTHTTARHALGDVRRVIETVL